MIVGGRGGRLDDEHVLAADVLLHLDENLLSAKRRTMHLASGSLR